MIGATVKRSVLVALIAVSAATLLWRASALDWVASYRSGSLVATVLVFLLFSLIWVAPYGLLWVLAQFHFRRPLTYWVQFALVVAPALLLSTPRTHGTDGLGDFLVSLLQIAIAVGLIACAFWMERRSGRLPNQRLERP